ncbi:MAG: hypothetical protein RL885_23670 [Planctomycetota bacterium]
MRRMKLALLWLAAGLLLPTTATWAQVDTKPKTEAPADAPSAEKILAKSIEAQGGEKAFKSVKKNRVTHASLSITAMGISGEVVEYHQRPDISIVLATMENLGEQHTGSRDGFAWDSSAMLGARLLEGAELKAQLRSAVFDKELRYDELYETVEVTGEATVDEMECWEVTFTPKKGEGEPEVHYFDKEKYLLRRMVSNIKSPTMGQMRVQMDLKDWKKFGQLLMPSKIVQTASGAEVVLKVEKVEFDVEIPEEKLVPPAAVQKLIDKKKAKDSGDGQ